MMLGVFLAFGVDTIILVGALWYVGQIPGETAGVVSAVVLVVFALWIFARWVRFRWTDSLDNKNFEGAGGRDQREPLEQLKQRYAKGEISDAEFEKQLDTIVDADRRAASSEDRSTLVLNDRGRE
jgi:uncharacterized membrane protein